MVRKTALVAVVLFAVTLGLSAQHVQTPSTWKLNTGESDFAGQPGPKSETILVLKDTDKWLSWRDISVDGKGATHRTSWSGVPDGNLKPITGSKGDKASFSSDGKTSHWEMAGGTVVDQTMSLSSDSKKATMDDTVTTKDGQKHQEKWVYDRVK